MLQLTFITLCGKYGWDKFTFEIIHENITSKAELNRLEKFYIAKFNSIRGGYNMTPGGESNPMDSEEIQIKHRKKMQSDDVRSRIRDTILQKSANNELWSDASRKAMSERKKKLYSSPAGDAARENLENRSSLVPSIILHLIRLSLNLFTV